MTPPAMLGIHHLAITVRELAVSEPFYASLFERSPRWTLDDGPFTRRVFQLDGPVNLGLTEHDAGAPDGFDPRHPGLDHVGFGCPDLEALALWAAHLDALGIAHSGIVSADYGHALSFADPDGIALEFFVNIPG